MKIAVLGTGNVATGNYLPVLKDRWGIELGYHNRNRAKAEAAARAFGGTVFADVGEVIAWRPDICFVLTSEQAHHATGLPLVEAGLPRIFFEKPLVAARGQAHVDEADFWQGRELLGLARDRGCEVAVMFNYRFFEQTLAARRLVQERGFGRLISVTGQVHYACWSHCIDLVCFFGGEVAEVAALEGEVEREGQGIRARDKTVAFRFSSGGTGTLIGTAGMKWQHPLFELTLGFEGGRLHMRDIDGDLEVLDGAGPLVERLSLTRDVSRWHHYNESFRKAITAYLDAVEAGLPPSVSGLDGLRELQFEAALRRSVREKRPVRVQAEFPL